MFPDMTCGTIYDFVIRVKSGGPVDFRTTPVTLVMVPPEGYDPKTQGILLRHLNGGTDRSENTGGQVRFHFGPTDTAGMYEGNWTVWFMSGTHNTNQSEFGRALVTVVKPEKPFTLTPSDT